MREPFTGEHEHYVGRLSVPYITPAGVVAIKFRCMKDHRCKDISGHAKYLPGNDYLYNVQALHDAERVLYVCEGELDAITATVAGFPCVASGSAPKFAEHWTKLFEGFEEVVGLCDGDEAGELFGKKLKDRVEWARLAHFPEGQDVNSFVMSHDTLEPLEKLLT